MQKLEAFEMRIYRRILRISWTEKVTNEKVLRRMATQNELITTIKTNKLEYFEYAIRES